MYYQTPYGKKYSELTPVQGQEFPPDVLDFIEDSEWVEVRKQRTELIYATNDTFLRYERQLNFGITTTNTPTEMTNLSTYVQTLRDLPQAHATPELAQAALDSLSPPITLI